jgi:hypothetical protein
VPTLEGGDSQVYASDKFLPVGLELNPTTGIISGTPRQLTLRTQYEITSTNTGGTDSVFIFMTVLRVPPSNLTYATMNATYIWRREIPPNVPSAEGTVLFYMPIPPLPPGFVLDITTGTALFFK